MSIVNLFDSIDQALLKLALNDPKRLEALKRTQLEFIEIVDKNLKDQYSIFD